MPALDPKQFFWTGETALLRYWIQRWKNTLNSSLYSSQESVNFLYKCIPKLWQYVLDKCDTLDEICERLMMYTSNEDMYLLKAVESIKKHPHSTSYKDDKVLLAFFD